MTDPNTLAEYRFVPWVRQGYQPSDAETLADPIEDPSSLTATLTVEGSGKGDTATSDVSLDVDMYGPSDVVGVDDRQVVRMEPEPHTGDFSPNYFPMVEFDRADLPWLLSPVSGDDEGKLRPWCCLVVVEQREGVEISASGEKPLPTLTIGGNADPAAELPDPVNSWAWAHAQVVGEDGSAEFEFRHNTTKTVSRLVAPRRLEPGTSYHAAVVPTFEPGRLAGLGREPYPGSDGDQQGGRSGDVAMAWDLDEVGDSIELPVYHTWEFSTGNEGDFESLVRALDPEVLDGLGYRDVDASDPGVEALSTRRTPTDVRLEGALKSAELDELFYPDEMREELRELANADDHDDDGRPTFGPPVYGKYHADVAELPDAPTAGESSWLRELNVDPRHRIAAGFGTEVVREQQEQLVASAWDQVGDVRAANELLRRARLARESSNHVHDDLRDLSPAEAVAATAGMHDRATWTGSMQSGDDVTFRQVVDDSRIPAGVLSPELRRLLRPDGPITGRLGDDAPDQSDLVRAFERSDPVTVEREGWPDGAVLLTREEQDTEYGSFADLCPAVRDRSQPPPPTALLHDRVDAVEQGTESEATLRDECWDACGDAQRAVAAMESGVSSDPAATVLADFAARLSTIAGQRGGSYDDATNLLAGLDAAIDAATDPDVPDTPDVLSFAGAVGRELDAVLSGTNGLDRLADDLPPAEAGAVRSNADDLRAACRTLRSALAVRVFERLVDVCSAATAVVPSQVPQAGESTDDVETAMLAVCGPSDASGLGGLTADLSSRVSAANHGWASRTLTEIRRLVALATDATADMQASGVGGVEPVASVCRDLDAAFDLLAAEMGQQSARPLWDEMEREVCSSPGGAPSPDPPLGLGDAKEALLDATDPEETIPRRVNRRIGGATGLRDDPLDTVLAAPEFPKPMYEPLADLSQEYLLPGVGDVPKDAIGVLETNPEFVRSYMVGLNHEMARELQWREYPTDMRGTYFDRFWGAKGAIPEPDDPSDIDDIHSWDTEGYDAVSLDDPLRRDDESAGGGNAVLLIRGELLRRYPNTTIYAAEATYRDTDGDGSDDERVPDLPTDSNDEAPDPDSGGVKFPMFRGHLDSDLTFFGFDLGVDEARGTPEGPDDPGWFFVIEEAPSEPRLGLDVNQDDVGTAPSGITGASGSGSGSGTGSESGWSALSWGHMVADEGEDPLSNLSYIDTETARPGAEGWQSTAEDAPEWGRNGAHMAAITWQKPFRIAIHADDMLPADEDGGGSA